jgi:hypothetical protein
MPWSFFASEAVLAIIAMLPDASAKGNMMNSLRKACLHEQDYIFFFCDCPGWLRMAQDKIAEDGSGYPLPLQRKSPRMELEYPG